MSGVAEHRGEAAASVRVGGRAKPNTGNERDYEAQPAQRQPNERHMSPGFRMLIRNS